MTSQMRHESLHSEDFSYLVRFPQVQCVPCPYALDKFPSFQNDLQSAEISFTERILFSYMDIRTLGSTAYV